MAGRGFMRRTRARDSGHPPTRRSYCSPTAWSRSAGCGRRAESEVSLRRRMDESELLAERRRKLERLREAGVEPFPENFHGRTPAAEVLDRHAGLKEEEEATEAYRLAGRLAARRGHGRAAFLDIEDRSGRIQLHARQDVLGEEKLDRLITLDLGDLIGVEGVPFR